MTSCARVPTPGATNGAAVLATYYALASGPVAVVAPVVATYPLFTLALSALRDRPQDIPALAFAMILRHAPKGQSVLLDDATADRAYELIELRRESRLREEHLDVLGVGLERAHHALDHHQVVEERHDGHHHREAERRERHRGRALTAAADLAAIEARLTGPGGPFEIAVEDVLGARMPVFKNRLRSLRGLLELSSAQGEKEYLVHRDRRISYDEHLRLVAKLAGVLRDALRPHEVLRRLAPRGQAVAQQLRVADDRGQQVVEVVRDAARELGDSLHLVRVVEPSLEHAGHPGEPELAEGAVQFDERELPRLPDEELRQDAFPRADLQDAVPRRRRARQRHRPASAGMD